RAHRTRGETVSPPGLHENLCTDRSGHPLHHPGPGIDPDFSQGPDPVRGRELAGPDDDRNRQADAVLADGPAGTGDLVVQHHCRPGLRRLEPLGRGCVRGLNEGSILDMPTTVPRASITEAGDDLKARDAILRTFPEVWQVVGKAGRAETATDPSPLDMVETVINLRDHELWPKRKLKFEDALAQTGVVLSAMETKGILRSDPTSDRRTLVSEAAMEVETRV